MFCAVFSCLLLRSESNAPPIALDTRVLGFARHGNMEANV